MRLEAYLTRVDYEGSLAPTLETLTALHRAHLTSISYENLDIHLGRPLVLKPERIFEKLVLERRGGWCYEMNALFARVLRELGFEVTLLGGAVNRARLGTRADLNHLALLVSLEQPYLADVGFGDGFLEPLPLQEGRYRQGFLEFGLSRVGEVWTFHNHAYGAAPGFEFNLVPRRLKEFEGQCHRLQTAPESGFVQVTVCQRFKEKSLLSLRGATLKTVTRRGIETRVIDTRDEFVKVLCEDFGLCFPEVADLWPQVWASHLAWQAAGA